MAYKSKRFVELRMIAKMRGLKRLKKLRGLLSKKELKIRI